ncbi:MAG: PIN domain nuclease [Candidatus Electrothrix aestuarii]|uniref:Ribonuclease VapC n=1 Tax=Candidatus Electrothrix aestuarii TaxID=3062594 RepID=A0AAU8LPZ6_9BACT|nr:PIN domain nuclease [Candidatus Electrothrix aestuarii]
MILADTSVLIDLFKGNDNGAVRVFREIIQQEIPFGITSVIYQEVLQGAKTEKEYDTLKEYLSTQIFYHPKDPLISYAEAAEIYFTCRRKGITIRSTIDCLIAQTALEHQLFLLHNDRDFQLIAQATELQLYEL